MIPGIASVAKLAHESTRFLLGMHSGVIPVTAHVMVLIMNPNIMQHLYISNVIQRSEYLTS